MGTRHAFTTQEDGKIAALRGEGKTAHEIAIALNRPYSSIRYRAQQLLKMGKFAELSSDERETRVVASRTRRTARLLTRAESFVANMPSTKDMGYVIGVLYGDGFVNFHDIERGIPKSIGLTTTNESFRDAFAHALEAWRGKDTVKRVRRTVSEVKAPGGAVYRDVVYFDALLHDRHLTAELLRIIGPTQTDVWKINVKDAVERGPAFCDGIIQGLFDSDGSFSSTESGTGVDALFGTVSEDGANSLCELMKFRGYDISLNPQDRIDHKRFHRVRIRSGASWLQYAEQIGSRIDYKAKLLTDFARRRRDSARQ
jgi:hypothetical protein